MIVLWLLGGIGIVTLAYLLPANAVDPWGPLNTAGIAAALYLLALTLFALRPPLSKKVRLASWVVVVIVGASLFLSWKGYDDQSHYQAGVLSKIRISIARGVIANELSEPLLQTLEAYYAQPPNNRKSLGSIFRNIHKGVTEGWDIHEKSSDADRLSVIVTVLNDTEVMIVAEEGSVKGDDPEFKNRSGNKGMMEESARLTQGGIVYEKHN